jgi:P-type conjugative transfer protein TrbG
MDPRRSMSLLAASAATALMLAAPIIVVPSQAEAQARQSRPSATQARPTRTAPAAAPAARPAATAAPAPAVGPAAIRAANAGALAPSRADGFVNAAQVFGYETGRVYEVWTAPMRITTITLEPGERITSKAAGDTERWMIGDTTSGEGATQQSQILIKPFRAGIATNMVITTNRRMYLLSLRSAESAEAFNAVVMWTHPAPAPIPEARAADVTAPPVASNLKRNENYRIRADRRRAPDWTPLSVSDDGRQTFIMFPSTLGATEAPPLFVLSARGEAQLVNWRKQGDVYVVDRLFDRAELRLGDARATTVRIERMGRRHD